ncbi:cytochrome P450 [Nonomuraea sp. NPDC048916]|uniref:tyrosine-type recombinase/integrase n=1 Tax=Nonomuraea sp. NPDC048916 TaxID=3154232 RepID=UPI0033D93919
MCVSTLSADWDPAAFKDPAELDVERGARHHLAFGFGPHQCLGQNLARMELPKSLPRPAAAADVAKVLAVICPRRPRKDLPLDRLRDRVLFETAYVCGARASEVCGLYVEDLDLRLDGEHVRIHGKGGNVRTVLLDDRGYVTLLKLYLTRAGYTAGPLFRAPINGRGGPLSYDAAHHRWQTYCAAARVEIDIHQLRHAHATELINAGVFIEAVRRRLDRHTLSALRPLRPEGSPFPGTEPRRTTSMSDLTPSIVLEYAVQHSGYPEGRLNTMVTQLSVPTDYSAALRLPARTRRWQAAADPSLRIPVDADIVSRSVVTSPWRLDTRQALADAADAADVDDVHDGEQYRRAMDLLATLVAIWSEGRPGDA